MRQEPSQPAAPTNPLGVDAHHLKMPKTAAKVNKSATEKRTLEQPSEQPPEKAKQAKNTQQGNVNSDWGVMGSTLTYRTAAIAMKNQAQLQQTRRTQQDSMQSENDVVCVFSQSADPASTKASEGTLMERQRRQQICPIGQLQSSQEDAPPEPTELLSKDRPNGFSTEERLRLAQRKTTHGHTHYPD